MPSLKALAEFKSSFAQIGGEEQARIAQNILPDDFPLPDNESGGIVPEDAGIQAAAPAGDFAGAELDGLENDQFEDGGSASVVDDGGVPPGDDSGGFIDFGDLGDLVGGGLDMDPASDAGSSGEMAALLDSISDTPPETEEAEIPELPENADPFAGLGDDLDLGDLSGFPDGGEASWSAEELPNEEAEDFPAIDGDLDLGDLPDFPDGGDSALPGMGVPEGLLDGLGEDLGFPGEETEAETSPPDESVPLDEEIGGPVGSEADFDIDSLDDLDFGGGDSTLPDTGIPEGLLDGLGEDLGFPGEEGEAETSLPDESADPFAGLDDNLDLGDFPDFPDDVEASGGVEEFPGEETEAETSMPDESADPFAGLDDNLDLGDFPDFPDDVEASGGTEGFAGGETEAFPGADDNLDLGDFPDFPDDGEAFVDEKTFGNEEIGGPVGSEADFDIDSLDALDFGGGDSALPDTGIPEGLLDGLDEDFGFPGEAGEAETSMPDENPDSLSAAGEASVSDETLDMPFPEGDDGLDLPEEGFSRSGTSPDEGDSFDNFNLDNDALAADFNIDVNQDLAGNFGDGFSGLDEFSIPGIDTPADGKARESGAAASLGTGAASSDVEEIQLSENEFGKLRETLSSYPLNLRLACEQLIVEEAVAPDLMANLIRLLVNGAPPKEAASLAGKILGKTITVPKGYEKKTGEAFETEQGSFAYIFVHNFLPVLRLVMGIAVVALSLGYLAWNFIYRPMKAESLYRQGYERIGAGEYAWANRRFQEAFDIYEKKEWFYKYAEAFRDERQYIDAERKYKELLYYTSSKNKRGIPEKQAVLDYADLMTNYTRDYQTADELLRRNILDYSVWDMEALLALGDNNLVWGEIEPARLEDAREAYAKIIERYGQSDPVLERMLKYFIRTDDLKEVLPLQEYFMFSEKRKISSPSLAELGGYLLDKSTTEVRGVPDEYKESIGGIREVLLRAVRTDQSYPESYYHLARYYEYYGNAADEALTLERSLLAFDAAKQETPKRLSYHINALRRYAEMLTNRREFFPAEEQLIKGINLYENGLARRVISRSPEHGRLYAGLGDLEYFVKSGDMALVLDYYSRAESSGYAPPELLYRMGAAHYQLRQWPEALNRFTAASSGLPLNRRILYSLGNVSYLRGNYYAAQGYYDRLLEQLEADRARFPLIMPSENEEQLELAERLMVAQNNMGVVLEELTARTGDNRHRSRALGLYSESERAWDVITRNPDSMIRMRPSPEITAPGVNPAYLNVQNSLRPVPGFEPQFFLRIDKDILEQSAWEEIAPSSYRLSEGLAPGL